jgi:hypothetical protein
MPWQGMNGNMYEYKKNRHAGYSMYFAVSCITIRTACKQVNIICNYKDSSCASDVCIREGCVCMQVT